MKCFSFSRLKTVALSVFLGATVFLPSNADAACSGELYFKTPESWTEAYVYLTQQSSPLTKQANGYWYIDLSKAAQQAWGDDQMKFKIISSKTHPANYVSSDIWGGVDQYSIDNNTADIKCPGDGNALYIDEKTDEPGVTLIANEPPNAQYFYIIIPDDEDWKSATPMISLDGGVTGKPMIADPLRCGFFYYVFFTEKPTDDVIVYRDDDVEKAEALGKNGLLEDNETPTPMNLATLFAEKGNYLYFMPDDGDWPDEGTSAGWYAVDPIDLGYEPPACEYSLAAIIYDTDASLHGAFTCNPDWFDGQTPAQAAQNACYTASAPYQVVASPTGAVPCIGVTKGMVTDLLDNNKQSPTYKKPVLTAKGQQCFGAQAPAAFTAMFTSTPNVNETYCVDMPFHKSDDGKWEFDSDTYQSPNATVPGGFYPAEAQPPADKMMSDRLPAAESKRKAEGPVFFCADYNNASSSTPEGLRTIHSTEGVPMSDLICNGPGWNGGVECDDLFAGGSEFFKDGKKTAIGNKIQTTLGVTFEGDGWGWSCDAMAPIGWNYYKKGTETKVGTLTMKQQKPEGDSRWGSGASDKAILSTGGRNQHFCFESHANFKYKPGLRFSFRGDDDIWIYIDNKLAVDLGGTHLAAPGYVNLDNFEGASGTLQVGATYDLDIFFCDRRTTMSNVRIKTNMYIVQKSGLSATPSPKNPDGSISYDICYEVSGGNSCAAAMAGNDQASSVECGANISMPIEYYVVNRAGDTVAAYPEISGKPSVANLPGVNLSSPGAPSINPEKIGGLPPGNYKLMIVVGGKKTFIKFRVKGNVDIVSTDVVYTPIEGDDAIDAYPAGTVWKFVGNALAGSRTPVYISAVSDADIDLVSAVGQSYSLQIDAGVIAYTSKDGDAVATFPRVIGPTGVDTIWLEVPLAGLTANPEAKNIGVKTLVPINFYAPEIKFVRDVVTNDSGKVVSYTVVTGDPDKDEFGDDYSNYKGADIDLFLLAWNPIADQICEECSFSLEQGESSLGVDAKGGAFSNGLAVVTVYSRQVYERPNAASFTILASESPFVVATYGNMFFIPPPCAIPDLVELYDTHGKPSKTTLRIPAPFFSENTEYLDGIADSIVIVYDRPFAIDTVTGLSILSTMEHPEDSLPRFICVNWDENKNFEMDSTFSYDIEHPRGTPNVKYKFKNNIGCSDTIPRADILAAFKSRPNDSTLVFAGKNLSVEVKTADANLPDKKKQAMSVATFKKGNDLQVQGFYKDITDRIPPVILKARIVTDSTNADYDNIKFTFSEPLKAAADGVNLREAMSYYVYSAGTIDPALYPYDASRYLTPSALQDMATGSEEATVRYRHKQGEKMLPTPQNGDYARFAVNVLVDTLGNAPTGYDAAIPSPWFTITGDTRSYIVTNTFSTLNPNDPLVQQYMANKTVTVVGFMGPLQANRDSVKAAYPNTVGHLIMTDMANLFEKYQMEDSTLTPADVYLKYEVYYFTNLGTFVSSDKREIQCTDESVFGAGMNCTTNPGYIYVGWTGVTNDGRLAGSGAYVSKFTSALVLGKHKAGKEDQTNTFGFRRVSK